MSNNSSSVPWRQVDTSAAERYERELVPAMFGRWAPVLVDLAAPRPGERVLDLACGTGAVTRLLPQRVGPTGRVAGLDLNPAMLAVARHVAPDGEAIEWIEASALDMPLPDGAFDVVLCQQGLQQFPDRPAALAEMRRVLRPGGRLALSVWNRLEKNPGMAALVAALQRHVGDAAANNRRAPCALGDAGEVERLVQDAGFTDVRLKTLTESARFPSPEAFVDAQLAGTPLSTLGTVTETTRHAIEQAVRAALSSFVQADDALVIPTEVHLITATAPV